MIDTVIRDGTVVSATEIGVASIAVDRGRVIMVGDQSFMSPARETIEHVVDDTFYHGRDSTISIHMGQRLVGKPRLTMLGGKTLLREWKTVGEPGAGRYTPSVRF